MSDTFQHENQTTDENNTNILPLVSTSTNPVLQQSDTPSLPQSQSSATPDFNNNKNTNNLEKTTESNVPYFESDEDTNETEDTLSMMNNTSTKKRHKNSRSTTSLLSSIGASIKQSIKNSPKANTIFNTLTNNSTETGDSSPAYNTTFDNIQYTDSRRATTTSLPKNLSSIQPSAIYQQSSDTTVVLSTTTKSDRNPMKKKKKKKHRKSDSKPIAGVGGLMSKFKQFQNRNNPKTKSKKKKSENSRHKMVEVQPKPFQKKKKSVKKTKSESKHTSSHASSLKRSKSKNTKHTSHHSKHSKSSINEVINKYSTSSSSLLTAGEARQISKQMKLSKRHSMHPVKNQRAVIKKRSDSKCKSANYSSADTNQLDEHQHKRSKKKKRDLVGSDMSHVRATHKKIVNSDALPLHATQIKARKSELSSLPQESEHVHSKHSKVRETVTEESRSGRSSSNSHKKKSSHHHHKNSIALTEEEEHELYVRKRDKYCKFRIKNEIFEIYDYYKPIRLCGSGAYAVVCEAIDTRTKKKVAIKKNKHIFDDIRDARRILREIKLLVHYQQCKHPDVIELYDTLPPAHNRIDDFDDVYCVMPLMETNLCKIITSKQPLTNLHYQYLTYQVLRGLKYIHSSGVIHRDIKPENILLNGSDCDVKIIDFGLARGVCPEEDEQKEARTEYVCTRWYRSPEVMCSGGHYDEKMDIWGVGCIMAEMILRNPLFPGQNYLDQLSKIFDVMGTPETVDWILNDQARAWVSKLEKHNGKDLKSMMRSKFDTEEDLNNCVDLLHKLLTLNPAERISAGESLLHPYFEDIHDEDECFDAPAFDLSFEFEKSIKTKFGVRHMMYEALKVFHNKKWAKIKKRKKKKKHRQQQEQQKQKALNNSGGNEGNSNNNVHKSGK